MSNLINLRQTKAKFLSFGNHYFVMCNGKMHNAELINQTYDFTTGVTTYTVSDIDTKETFSVGYDDMYLRESDFKANIHINQDSFSYSNQSKYQIEQNGEDVYAINYVFEQGKPRQIKHKITSIYEDKYARKLYDANGLVEGYESYDICLDFNSYIKNEKGEDIKINGRCVKLLLSDEQKALVKKFEDVMQELEDNNISVINHDYISGLFFVNNGGEKLDISDYEDRITNEHMRYLYNIDTNINNVDDCYNIVP